MSRRKKSDAQFRVRYNVATRHYVFTEWADHTPLWEEDGDVFCAPCAKSFLQVPGVSYIDRADPKWIDATGWLEEATDADLYAQGWRPLALDAEHEGCERCGYCAPGGD